MERRGTLAFKIGAGLLGLGLATAGCALILGVDEPYHKHVDGTGGAGGDCDTASQCPALECQDPTCDMQTCGTTNKAAGTSCSSGKCDGSGNCVECSVNADCASNVCDVSTFKCFPAQCGDLSKNGDETDVDCGGSCANCPGGKTCNGDNDCQSNACVGSICCNQACGACEACPQGQCVSVAVGTTDPACANMEVCGPNAMCVGTAGAACNQDGDCLSGSCCLAGACNKNKCQTGGSGAPCATNADCTSNTCSASHTCT